MFLFKVIVLVALVGSPALAGTTKGLEQQRDEQFREEPASQQQVLAKIEEQGDRKLPARSEAKGLSEEKKPLDVIKIEQERPQQQIEEQEAVKSGPESQVEQVVREDTKRATFSPPIQQQQQRDETAQLEEPRPEQVQIKQELELPQKQEEIKGAEVRQLEHVKRQPEVLLRSAADVGRLRSSWSTKDSTDSRPLRGEHREENKPLPPVKTYAKTYNQEAPKLYTLGRLFGGNSQYQDSSYYQPSYSSQSFGYPYYQSQPSYAYPQPSYGYSQSSYGSPYYRGQSYTTGGSYTRYAPQQSSQQTSSAYLYPNQRQPVYVREYYLPAPASAYYQAPSSYSSPQVSPNYRLHYSESQPIKSRRVGGLSVDEHTSVSEE